MLAGMMGGRQDSAGGHGGPSSGLVGAGGSRVGISGAMRARDVSRVRPEDLDEAERTLVVRHAGPAAGAARAPGPAVPGPPSGAGHERGSAPETS